MKNLVKYLFIILLPILTILISPQLAEQQAQEHFSFLPIIYANRCSYGFNGIAWLHAGRYDDLSTLCAEWYYNYRTSFPSSYLNAGGIPMLWCDFDDRTNVDFYKIAEMELKEFDQIVLAINEPGLQSQCNRTPYETAIIFHKFEGLLPDAKLIGPNIIAPYFLDEFIRHYEQLYGHKPQPYRWAFHHYDGYTDITERLDFFCKVLRNHDYVCENLWITEYGANWCAYPNASQVMFDWTNKLQNDLRVETFAVYTNRTHTCFYLIDDNDKFTPVGEQYIRAIEE